MPNKKKRKKSLIQTKISVRSRCSENDHYSQLKLLYILNEWPKENVSVLKKKNSYQQHLTNLCRKKIKVVEKINKAIGMFRT